MADNQNIENTLKKMAVVLEKVVKKVDELDQRVTKLEMKLLSEEGKKGSSTSVSTQPQQPVQSAQPQTGSGGMGGFGTGFLSSLLGSFAGMSLFNLLFNNDVSPHEVAEKAGLSEDELKDIEEKLDNLSQEVSEIDEKLDSIDQNLDDIASSDMDTGMDFADFEPDVDEGFDFGGFDDIDMV